MSIEGISSSNISCLVSKLSSYPSLALSSATVETIHLLIGLAQIRLGGFNLAIQLSQQFRLFAELLVDRFAHLSLSTQDGGEI